MEAYDRRLWSWLQPQQILLDVEAEDRQQALERAAAAIAATQSVDQVSVGHALWRREQAASTALGGGFAVPHARIAGLARPITAFLRTTVGLPFHAPDGKPVSQLLVILVPADGANDDHLRLLALVTELFSDSAFRRDLGGATDVPGATAVFQAAIARMASLRG